MDGGNSDIVATALSTWRGRPGALMPILHAVQDGLGHVPASAVPVIAKALNLTRAEIEGVVSYYPFFRAHPPGAHVVRLCRAEACQSVGADALARHATSVLGCDFDETTPDGKITLEPVFCFGQCACGPAATIDDRLVLRLTPARLDALLRPLTETPG
jgi:formate dehydrogenase subunit gamma